MGAIPPPTTGQTLVSVLQNIQGILQSGSVRGYRTNDLLNRNLETMRGLVNGLRDFGNVGNNLKVSFNRADDLQRKSLAIGSNLNKLLSTQNSTLKGLRGDFFANAEDILLNFSTGIRENSGGLNTLMNRMRLTGQSTDILRDVMGDIQMETGNSVDAIDRLSQTNIELGKTYKVANQDLIAILQATKQLREVPSFIGGAEQAAQLSQSLLAAVGPKGQEQVIRTLDLLLDPDKLQTRIALGVGNATDRLLDPTLTLNDQFQELRGILQTAESSLRSIAGNAKGSLKNEITSMQLDALGDKSSLIALSNLTKVLESQLSINSDFMSFQENNLDSVKTLEQEALNFYQIATGKVFPILLTALPALLGASVGANVLAAGGGILGRLGGVGAVASTGLRFLGPIGAAVGLALSFGPDLVELFTKSTNTQKEELAELKSINRNTEKPLLEKEKSSGGTFSQFIANNLRDIALQSPPRNKELEIIANKLERLIEINENIRARDRVPSRSRVND